MEKLNRHQIYQTFFSDKASHYVPWVAGSTLRGLLDMESLAHMSHWFDTTID